jgi:hypothetical protein
VPDDPFYLEMLATTDLSLQQPDEALKAIEKLLAWGPASNRSAEEPVLQVGCRSTRAATTRGPEARPPAWSCEPAAES